MGWLASIPLQNFASIFRVEIDSELLQTLLSAMFTACSSSDQGAQAAAITASWSVLSALTQHCPVALSFAANFADSTEKARTEELLKVLASSGSDCTAIRGLLLLAMIS